MEKAYSLTILAGKTETEDIIAIPAQKKYRRHNKHY